MPKPITFKDIDSYLSALGVCRVETENMGRLYAHPESGAIIALPDLPADSAVPRAHLVAIRQTLINFGLVGPEESELLSRAG